MESVETFVEIFTKSWKDNNNDTLLRILKDLPGYLQNISKCDSDRVLEIILNEQRGLFKFIQTVLHMQKHQMANFTTSLKESFIALQFIMEFFQQQYEPYIIETRNICLYCMKTICWFYARKTAGETLQKLIKLFTNYDMQLDEIIQHYNDSYLKLYTRKDGCIFYIIIGAIGRYCPKIENMAKFIDSIFLQLLKDLQHQYKPESEKQPEEIKIYLECYLNLFVNFLPFEEDPSRTSVYFEKIYFIISRLCEPNKSQKVVRNKTIYVLSTHMKHFSSFIFRDFKKWHTLFNNVVEDTENYTIKGALRSFYKIMASNLLKEDSQDIFLYFKNYFISNLCCKDLSSYKLQLIVYGLGEFSVAYEKYSPTEIYKMFQMIALRALPMYAKENKVNEDFEAIADYLQALSQILHHIPNVSLHQVSIVIELSIHIVKRFPELKITSKNHTINALKITFANISQLEKNLQREYFNSFFREGILWSCTHTLFIDVQLQQEIQNLPEYPVCYKNYLPLWQSLFRIDDQEKFTRCLILQIFDEFVSVLISFINKLNLNVETQENNFLPTTLSSLKAENETDFWFFINLVDLYVEIFEQIESIVFQNWIEKLLIYFINRSYKYPFIAGFYKIIEVILRKPDNYLDYQLYLSNSSCELISQYLTDILKLVCGFYGELQSSCISLIFNAPSFFIIGLINEMIPVFKIAFNIGLSNLPLAFCALNTLEDWMQNSDIKFSNDFLKNILYCLEPYLSSNESRTSIFQSFTKIKEIKEEHNTEIIHDGDGSLENLQKKILLFYGSLDSNVLFDFVHEKSTHTNSSWNKKDLLQCELLFPDIRLEIHLDKLIPRIIELTHSGNQKIKVSACELFHSVITIILGKKLMDQCFSKNLCCTVLRLGCDSDDSVRNLYHPFVIQLIHYLSSNLMKESRTPQYFIDSLFDSLADEFNPSLRDYCGVYLKEFMEWSIKQAIDNDLTNLSHVRSTIRRITTLALYPSNKKRLAAAIAFNHLYAIFRENLIIVNTYWLEFLHAFIKCMEEYDDIQIISAIDHVEKVIKVMSNQFNAKNCHRRIPPGFPDETLKGILIWLFNYCGSLNTKCRRKCIQLFENLFPLVSNSESVKDFLMNKVSEIALKDLEQDFECITINNGKAFLKTLDFYIWIIKKKLLSPKSLEIQDLLGNRDIFRKQLTMFVSEIVNQNAPNLTTLHANKLIEVEELSNLKSEITVKILDFISTILVEKENYVEIIPWDDNLFLLIIRCILCPQTVGLTAKKLQTAEKLSIHLESLLTLMMNSLSEALLQELRRNFSVEAKENFLHFAEINDIIALKKDIFTLKLFVKGLFIVKKCKFFNLDREHNWTNSYWEEKSRDIFKALKVDMMDNDLCKRLDEPAKEYLNELMKFYLEDYQPEVVKGLVNLIIIDDPLISLNGSTISHGEYFLETFKDAVCRCMLKSPAETLKVLDEFVIELPHKIFFLLEELLIFTQYNKTTESEILANEVIKRCNSFRRLLNDVEDRKNKFFNINRIAIRLKKNPMEAVKDNGSSSELYWWIFQELVRAKDLEKKSMILRNFLVCLTDESTESNHELVMIFQELRDENSIAYLQQLESNELLKFQAVACFQILLKMLIITKSLTVYRGIINYAAGIYKCLHKENIREYLNPYFASISDVNALKSLELAFKIFMDLTSIEERLDVLRYFLLASIESVKACVIEKFYEEKCQEMAMYITKKMDKRSSSNALDRKRLIVSKIGCYSMFEVMFGKFELKFVDVKDSLGKDEKALNRILVEESLEIRCFSALSEDEKEVTRLLQCAALNCCIAIVSLKKEEKFYKFIFMEDRKKNQLLWERIVDCDKKYDLLLQSGSRIRKDRKKLINIRRALENERGDRMNLAASYVIGRQDLSSLTLLEDIHAYDLNDARLLAQSKPLESGEDRRLDLSFENDELNGHECMPMISGVLVHMFNTGISSLPDTAESEQRLELPLYLKLFRNGFSTQQDNAILLLLKIVCNTKEAFLPYIQSMSCALLDSVCRYLSRNPLNYIIRDILVIVLEAKLPLPASKEDAPVKLAQRLLELLLEKAVEKAVEPRAGLHEYNLQLIESLCALWSASRAGFGWPRNLEPLLDSQPELGLRLLLILLRAGIREARAELQRPGTRLRRLLTGRALGASGASELDFEALGWLLRVEPEPELREQLLGRLLAALGRMEPSRSAGCACALYEGWRSEAEPCRELLSRFASPRRVSWSRAPELKLRCLRLYLSRLPGRLAAAESAPGLAGGELEGQLGLAEVLRERQLGCLGPALGILRLVAPLLPEAEARPYLRLLSPCCSPSLSLLEHRLLAYEILAEAQGRRAREDPEGLAPLLRLLLRGLEDPAPEVRDLLAASSRRLLRLPSTCGERLLRLLEAYRPAGAGCFSRFLLLRMLELSDESPEAERPMFRPLIESCAFRDWRPDSPDALERLRYLGSVAPLFAPSLLRTAAALPSSRHLSGSNLLASQQLLLFEPSAALASDDSRLRRIMPEPAENKLSLRRMAPPAAPAASYRERLRLELEARGGSRAKLYRKYRIGDFPDVEMTHASFVQSLRQVMLNDWLFRKQLTVELVCGSIERSKAAGGDKYRSLVGSMSGALERLLEDQQEEDRSFGPAALEIAQRHSRDIKLDAGAVGRTCRSMGLDSLGVVLLEEGSTDERTKKDAPEQPPAKRMKVDEQQQWIELARLYKRLGETDVVGSIFRREGVFSQDLRDGAIAQAEADWQMAKASYEMAYEVATGSEKEHCLESMFQCLRELSSWAEINKKVDVILNGDYHSVWVHPSKRQLLPWIFEAQLHKALEDLNANKQLDPRNQAFIQHFDEWIRESSQVELKTSFGQEMSVLFLCAGQTSDELARHCLDSCLDSIRQHWIRLSPLAQHARLGILTKLRGIYNIDLYMKTIKNTDIEDATRNLIQYWDQHLPSLNQDLSSWNMHVSYRLTFAHLLHEKLKDFSEDSSLLHDLILSSLRQRMKISELAMKNKNNLVAKKHTIRIERLMHELSNDETLSDNSEFTGLKDNFMLTACKYKFVCGAFESNTRKKCDYYVNSWKIANDIIDDESTNLSIKISVKHHLFDLTLALKKTAECNKDFLNVVMMNEFVLSNLETTQVQEFVPNLIKYSFNSLKSVCGKGNSKEMAVSYTKFGKYCYSLLQESYQLDSGSTLIEEFISSILNGMSLGSSEAAHYFPCLLKHEYYWNNEQAAQLFISKSSDVPSWLFLSWQAQIISYLGKPLAQLVTPIIQRLIKDYPNGVIYNFRQTYLGLSSHLRTMPDIRSMYESLFSDLRFENFIEAMHRICQPEYYLRHHLLQLCDSDEPENFALAIDSLCNRVFNKQTENQSLLQGPLFKVIDRYRAELDNLKSMDYQAAKQNLHKLSIELYEAMKQRMKKAKWQALQLKDYSPYLSHFSDKDVDLEIPGQYDECRKPIPRYHIKISKLDRFVRVMESKCNPIKISMIGNDAKAYGFLVKFGEDLRQDQRLQQIFKITNKTLDSDSKCKRRYLSINTYHVVPLSTSLGLIEWVDETKSLKEFIEFSMADKTIIETISMKYQNWIEIAGKPRQKSQSYREALIRYNSKDVISKMNELINHLEGDCLRKTFFILSPTFDCFVSLRRNFITSYATMCIIHWITGVGDRHLENMLIQVKTGKCYGIDFGSAFGAGIDQLIPELVPFRLTTQILGLLKPFDEQALFGVTMIHVLSALRNERAPILACLDIFIHEPLDWSKHRNKTSHDHNDQLIDVKWSPQNKINIVQKKLNGANPSTIMLEELSNMHDENEYYLKYKDIINGTDHQPMSVRSRLMNKSLTPEEQVQCLLEQAKDLNVLGRMWVGWCPFI